MRFRAKLDHHNNRQEAKIDRDKNSQPILAGM